jgi:glyoxylase-like metal-dependent hydrolase (beta-lactamase superfamily II)
MPGRVVEVAAGVLCFRDTCNVYVLRGGNHAVLVDFGSGAVLDHLGELGVGRVSDVLLTHHHRDQLQGLDRAAAAGIRVWAPPVERELIDDVDRRWQFRQIDNDYDMREDRFSILEEVGVAGTVSEYRTVRYGDFDVYTLPTPGHTIGSVTYLIEVDGRRLAFTGDLLYGPGKVWSLAATQWSYTGVEGQAATHVSCGVLETHEPDVLLPSHGEPIADPKPALALTRTRLQELVDMRMENDWDLADWLARPWVPITSHLLRNRTSLAHSYALLSDSGSALLIDWGYDLTTGTPAATERSARRPLLASLDALRRDFGVERIEVVVPTHYHDDHVAGIALLRKVEGVEVWAPESVAQVLADPHRYDLPCLWFDPVPVDRTLAHGEPTTWREYELTAHHLPGHTLYAAAIAFEVDGKRVLAIGDQYGREASRAVLNYQYRNRFRIDDYVRSAELFLSLRPDVIVGGHWQPWKVADGELEQLLTDGRRLAELHRELLPLDEVDFGAEGFGARIEPYRSELQEGEALELEVTVRNPFEHDETATVRLAVPEGWAAPDPVQAQLPGRGESAVRFRVTPAGRVRRARVAADLTVGEVPFGQQAEALVDVR